MIPDDFFVQVPRETTRVRQEAGIAALLDLASSTAPGFESPAAGIAQSPQAATHLLATNMPDSAVGLPSRRYGLMPLEATGMARPVSPEIREPERHESRYQRQLAVPRTAGPGRAVRLLRFAAVGGSGVAVNLLVLALLLRARVGAQWPGGQIVAAIAASQVAIGWNFVFTDRWVFPVRSRNWAARLLLFWALSCAALLAQFPLAARLQALLGSGAYVLAAAAALGVLMLARFAVCEGWLYRPAGRRRVTIRTPVGARFLARQPETGRRHRRPRLARILTALIAVIAVVMVYPGTSAPAHASVPPPALAQVDASIALAQGYLDGLFKPLPGGQAVQSEFYGLPLRAYFPGYRQWVLLGEGHAGQCLTGCSGLTSIIAGPSGPTWEAETVLFATPGVQGALRADVTVNWTAFPGHFAVTVSHVTLNDQATAAQLWLGQTLLATYRPHHSARQVTRVFPDSDRSVLQSLRYTVRHGTQEAYLYWRARGNASRAGLIAAFLRSNGFTPGVDLRAALFGQGAALPAAMPFTTTGPDNAYPDCSHLPPPSPAAYPYTSKVCLVGVETFLLTGRSDPFLQAFEALQTLNTYPDPGRRYPLLLAFGLDGATPDQTAGHLQQLWDQLGYGIPECNPAGCVTTQASGLRSFAFGALETLLAYRFGQAARRQYADAAAAAAIATQIGQDGVIHIPGQRFIRPAQAGAYPIYWNASHQFTPLSKSSEDVSDLLSMPPEYDGLIVSDAETTFDGWAFLTIYRCARFSIGCQQIPDPSPRT